MKRRILCLMTILCLINVVPVNANLLVRMNTIEGKVTSYSYPVSGVSQELMCIMMLAEVEVQQRQEQEHARYLELRHSRIVLLAHLIWNEAGILGKDAMYIAGSVVLNREKSSKFPNTMVEVISQPGQYDVVRTGKLNNEVPKLAYDVATDLIDNGSTVPSNVLYQAEFKQGTFVYRKIGNTYFCGE